MKEAGLMKEGRGDVEMDFPLIPSPPFDRLRDHRERARACPGPDPGERVREKGGIDGYLPIPSSPQTRAMAA